MEKGKRNKKNKADNIVFRNDVLGMLLFRKLNQELVLVAILGKNSKSAFGCQEGVLSRDFEHGLAVKRHHSMFNFNF